MSGESGRPKMLEPGEVVRIPRVICRCAMDPGLIEELRERVAERLGVKS